MGSDAWRLVAEVVDQGRDLNRLSRDLVEHFRNLLVARLVGTTKADVEPRRSGATAGHFSICRIKRSPTLAPRRAMSPWNSLLDYFDFMAAGEDEIARSATPRFVLETLLMRLATLPKTLPVSELIERLERLEGKVLASGKALPVPVQILRGRRRWFRSSQRRRCSLQKSECQRGRFRERLAGLSFPLSAKRRNFWPRIWSPQLPLELPPGPLKIGVAERHHLSYLQDSENSATLKHWRRDFLREMSSADYSLDGWRLRSSPSRTVPAHARCDDRSEMVKEALRIFGGSIEKFGRENG